MWTNDGTTPLFVVKRKNAEEYHTGSYSSATPKLYKLGNAKAACKELNGMFNRSWTDKWNDTPQTFEEYELKYAPQRAYYTDFDTWIKDDYEMYLKNHAKGPWIIALVQMAATEYLEVHND